MLIETALCALLGLIVTVCKQVPPEVRAFYAVQQEEHDRDILVSSVQWGVDPFLMKGLLWTESGLLPGAEHKRTGALGIAQFTTSGRRAVVNIRKMRGVHSSFSRKDTLDPTQAIPAAAEMLSYLERYCGSTVKALAAYNTGSCRFRQRGFVLKVVRHTNRYRVESGLPPLPSPFKKAQALRRLPTSRTGGTPR